MKTALTGAKLIDGTGRTPIANSLIVIDESKIEYAGPPAGGTPGPEADPEWESVDVSGKFVMPGLIDSHVHLCGIMGKDVRDWVLEPKMQQAIVSSKDSGELLLHGVTTVADNSQNGLQLKLLTEDGKIPGPRIFACGRGLCRTGGYIDSSGLPPQVIQENHPWAILCDGRSQIRKAIRSLVREGADGVKIWATSSGRTNRPGDTDQHYSASELEMITEEASFIHMPVFAHCQSLEGAKAALIAGVRNIIHGEELDEECRSLMLEKKAVFIPTLKLGLDWLNYGYDEIPSRYGISDYPGDTPHRKEYNRLRHNFKQAYESGVTIAAGSDTFCRSITPYGKSTLEELYTMADEGMTAKDVIISATRNGAYAMAMEGQLGTLEKGKYADLLILDKDPLENIRNISVDNMYGIMKSGRFVRFSGRRGQK